ncbi:MAG: maleylpyruvate isomerase family mycothiol-dependent enzyme [Acidimicrobiales bacterium]
MRLLDVLRAERRASVDTLRLVGPKAPTLCDGWQAKDIATHLYIQDRGAGLPMVLTAPIGMPLLRLGVRAPSWFAARFEAQQQKVIEAGWDGVLVKLAAGPPPLAAIPFLGPVRLHENWIHHEDVRRVTDSTPRPTTDAVDDALWAALRWYGPYQRKLLKGVAVLLKRDNGDEQRIGDKNGERVTVSGPAGEIALVVAGRHAVSKAGIAGPDKAVAMLHAPHLSL